MNKLNKIMIILVDAEKVLNEIQHLFMIKTSKKLVIERTYLNAIKAIYDKSPANIVLNEVKLEAFPQISITRVGCSLSLVCNIVLEALATVRKINQAGAVAQ